MEDGLTRGGGLWLTIAGSFELLELVLELLGEDELLSESESSGTEFRVSDCKKEYAAAVFFT